MESHPIRLIDELGRIVLPKEVRLAMEWGERTPVEICLDVKENAVVIKKHHFTCIFCGGEENLKEYQKHYICSVCKKNIAAL